MPHRAVAGVAFAAVLAVLCVLAVPARALGVEVSTLDQLKSALGQQGDVLVTSSITVEESIDVTGNV